MLLSDFKTAELRKEIDDLRKSLSTDSVNRLYFCCGSILLLVLAVRIYTLVQLLC